MSTPLGPFEWFLLALRHPLPTLLVSIALYGLLSGCSFADDPKLPPPPAVSPTPLQPPTPQATIALPTPTPTTPIIPDDDNIDVTPPPQCDEPTAPAPLGGFVVAARHAAGRCHPAAWTTPPGPGASQPLASPAPTRPPPEGMLQTYDHYWKGHTLRWTMLARQLSPRRSHTLAQSPAGTLLYVAQPEHDALAIVDTAAMAPLQQLRVGRAPSRVAVGNQGRVFVSLRGERAVAVLSPGPVSAPLGYLCVGAEPQGLALSIDGQILVVANRASATVMAFDTASYALLWSRAVEAAPAELVVTPNNQVYVIHARGGVVTELDVRDGCLRRTVYTGPGETAWSAYRHPSGFAPASAGIPAAGWVWLPQAQRARDPGGRIYLPQSLGAADSGQVGGCFGRGCCRDALTCSQRLEMPGLATLSHPATFLLSPRLGDTDPVAPRTPESCGAADTQLTSVMPPLVPTVHDWFAGRDLGGPQGCPEPARHAPSLRDPVAATLIPSWYGEGLLVVFRASSRVALVSTRSWFPGVGLHGGFEVGPRPRAVEVVNGFYDSGGSALTRWRPRETHCTDHNGQGHINGPMDCRSADRGFVDEADGTRLSVLELAAVRPTEGSSAGGVWSVFGGGGYDHTPDTTVQLAEDDREGAPARGRDRFFAVEDPSVEGRPRRPLAAAPCSGCHPEGGEDGRVWPTLPVEDFRSLGPARTPDLRTVRVPAPRYGWRGATASLNALHGGDYPWLDDDAALAELQAWLDTLPPRDLPRRGDPQRTAAVARGEALFESSRLACAGCHGPGGVPDDALRDTLHAMGDLGRLRAPDLRGVSLRAPYFHDGRALDLPSAMRDSGRHGLPLLVDDMAVEDLLEYLHTL